METGIVIFGEEQWQRYENIEKWRTKTSQGICGSNNCSDFRNNLCHMQTDSANIKL